MRVKSAVTLMVAVLGIAGSMLFDSQVQAQQYPDYRRDSQTRRMGNHRRWQRPTTMIPAGTVVTVRLDTKISTENASQGDTWSGTVTQTVQTTDNYGNSYNQVGIPAGSEVQGVVTYAVRGTRQSQPQIALAVQRVNMNGRSYVMTADTEPIVGGTQRAKRIGAIAGGAAVGALVGHAVAGEHHGTLIGGALGGLAGYGATRNKFRTLQLKPGTELTFTTREDVVASRYDRYDR